jgi:hypothetical protein
VRAEVHRLAITVVESPGDLAQPRSENSSLMLYLGEHAKTRWQVWPLLSAGYPGFVASPYRR